MLEASQTGSERPGSPSAPLSCAAELLAREVVAKVDDFQLPGVDCDDRSYKQVLELELRVRHPLQEHPLVLQVHLRHGKEQKCQQ